MNEAIKTLIDDKAGSMLDSLQDIGFAPDQARRFLEETSREVLYVLTNRTNKFEFNTASEISLISILVGKIDASTIGTRLGIEPGLANNGLQTILPSIANRAHINELVAATTAHRGLMHRIKGMFGHVAGG
jgi:hypothetical protein